MVAVIESHIASVLKNIPEQSGVYLFKDKQEAIIYIGKAKQLRTRVRSYFRKQHENWKVEALIEEYASLDYILTSTELEALLLEAQLIKEYQPKYNVLLKHGNPFLFILFTRSSSKSGLLPQVKLVKTKKEKGTYFGPFLHKKEARTAYRYLMRTFQLSLCNKKIENGCLDYHLGLCAGSCLSSFDHAAYSLRLDLARKMLVGSFGKIESLLKNQRDAHLACREFEKARTLHGYLENLPTIFATLQVHVGKAKTGGEALVLLSTPSQPQTSVSPLENATYKQGLIDLQALLNLPTMPKTIDCFDISHFQSRDMVASSVRFTPQGPDKQSFRRIKIKSLQQQNDYAALQEAVLRRYARLGDVPDVILIDGGKGQLSSVLAVMPDTCCISLAKREERLFTALHPEGITLDIKTPLGQLLIALRDYAHHFAISYHKLLRIKGMRADEG